MNLNVISITQQEIEASAVNSVHGKGAGVMFLHNYGDRNQDMNKADLAPWVDEDLDD